MLNRLERWGSIIYTLFTMYVIPGVVVFFLLYFIDVPFWSNILITYCAISLAPGIGWFHRWVTAYIEKKGLGQDGCLSIIGKFILLIYGYAFAALISPIVFPYTFFLSFRQEEE